jgi:hypothetical protein
MKNFADKKKTSLIWLSSNQACKLLNIKRETLLKNCRLGKYESKKVKLNGKRDIQVLLQSLPVRSQNKYFSEKYCLLEMTEIDKEIRQDFAYDVDLNLDLFRSAPEWSKKQAEKYLTLLNQTKNLKGEVLKDFIFHWNKQNPDLKTSYSRLLKARKDFEESGLVSLLSKHGSRIGKTSLKPEWFKHFKKLYLVEGAPSVNSCWLMTLGHFKQVEDIDLNNFPSAQTFYRRLLKEVPKQSIYLARFGKSAWNRKYGNYVDRNYSQIAAGSCWVSDHAQVDVAVLDKSGKVVFPWITAWRDFKTSKWLGWLLHCEAPNSDHIFQSFYYAANEYGLPEDVYIDNGKDYRSKDFAGGRKVETVLIDEKKSTAMLMLLGIKPHFALPYNAQTKPIERDFLKNKEFLSKHFVGYRGGNITERPEKLKTEIKNGKIIAFADFKKVFDDFVINVLNKMPSKGKVLKGKSPDQLFAEEFTVKKTVSQDALMLFCMRTSRAVTVGRNGVRDSALQVTYWAEWMSPLKGEKVYLRRDINAYQEAWVFKAKDDSYLGKAQMAELVPALARTDIEKAKLKEALAAKNRDKKIAQAYLESRNAIDPLEKMNMLKAGVAALNPDKSQPDPKIMKMPNTFMDKVIKQEEENEKVGTYDLSAFVREKEAEEPIYLFETDKYYAELAKKKESL